jgi:hypothetical protein
MHGFQDRNGRTRARWGRRIAVFALAACLSKLAMAQTTAHATALQACPTVKQEITDLDMLADGLKNSNAVGMFEKLRLKSSIDELLDRLKSFHAGKRSYSMDQLQEQYDLLMMRIARQLQDKDLALHGQLCNAWEPLWAQLQDRNRFLEKFS